MGLTRLDVGARYSEAAVFNGVIYVAGQVADRSMELGVFEQTTEVLALIDALLERAQSSKSRILFCQVYLASMGDYAAFNAAWDAWVPAGHAPPRATVEARLARPEWSVEIVVTAAVDAAAQ